MPGASQRREYWRKTLRMTAVLMVLWFVVTYVVSYYARELNFDFFGWPFSFYIGAQGALIFYLLIILYYAWYMNQLDKAYGVNEEEIE